MSLAATSGGWDREHVSVLAPIWLAPRITPLLEIVESVFYRSLVLKRAVSVPRSRSFSQIRRILRELLKAFSRTVSAERGAGCPPLAPFFLSPTSRKKLQNIP